MNNNQYELQEVTFVFDSSGEVSNIFGSPMIGGIIYNIYDYKDAISFDKYGNITVGWENGSLIVVTKEAAKNNFDEMADNWCPSHFGFKSVDDCDNHTCGNCWNIALRS